MRALVQSIPGDPLSIIVGNVPIPEPPGDGQLLIRIHCAAINHLDLEDDVRLNIYNNQGQQRKYDEKGRLIKYADDGVSQIGFVTDPSDAEIDEIMIDSVPGIEISGTIVAKGENCKKNLIVNDAVIALLRRGGYAEFCVVDERSVIAAIPNINMHKLCAIPLAFMTAHQLCFELGNCVAGDCVLLHAAASSVGQAALQMLVRKGITVFTTVRQEAKRRVCLELGAAQTFVIDSERPFFAELIRTYNNGKLVNCILDPVGAAYLSENIDLLDWDGRLVQYDLRGGAGVSDQQLLQKLMSKRLSLRCSSMHTRSLDYQSQLFQRISEDPDALPAIASEQLRVTVDKTFEMEEILQAHRYVRQQKNIGKVVLNVTSTASAIEFFGKELNSMAQRNKMRIGFIRK